MVRQKMIETICISALTVSIGSIATYFIIKKTVNVDTILDFSDAILDEITNNPEMQKKAYLLGVLIGNGIKTGVGLTKGKGKFSFQSMLGEVIAGIFSKGQSQSSSQSTSNKTVEDLLKT